jgi:hypothetical protein
MLRNNGTDVTTETLGSIGNMKKSMQTPEETSAGKLSISKLFTNYDTQPEAGAMFIRARAPFFP